MPRRSRPSVEAEPVDLDPDLRDATAQLFGHMNGLRDLLAALEATLTRLATKDPERLGKAERRRDALPRLGALEHDLVEVAARSLELLIRTRDLDDPEIIVAHRGLLLHLSGIFEGAGQIVRRLANEHEGPPIEHSSP